MNLRFGVYLVVFITVLFLAVFLFVRSRPAYRQTANEVVIRQPGDRFLGPPQPAAEEAKADLQFAWLSQVAYDHIPPPEGVAAPANGCPDPYSSLSAAGWSPWLDFPDEQLKEKIAKSHLRVEVWMNPPQDKVVVALGGTVASSLKDWEANLRWFIPYHNDEYTKLMKEVEPQFVAEFKRRKQTSDGLWLDQAKIYSTGHSLGAGLAQEFAYALPIDPSVPRVTKVFAFDPSPVTGYTSVDRTIRDVNRQDLFIDRIYERREILAIFRSVTNFIDPPRVVAPVIRQLRYNLFPRGNYIKNHSISELACKLNEASRN